MIDFYADRFGYYERTKTPQGGIASISFFRKCTYDYEVRRIVKQAQSEPIEEGSKGTITVK